MECGVENCLYNSLSRLNEFNIPRWTRCDNIINYELHGFADASAKAYAAVIYIRTILAFSHISTHLLIGKSKVAPIKPVTIPRLELTAAVLLAKLLDFVQASLHRKEIPCYGWTDSTVALFWINSHPSKWKAFVAHRVTEIQRYPPLTGGMSHPTRTPPTAHHADLLAPKNPIRKFPEKDQGFAKQQKLTPQEPLTHAAPFPRRQRLVRVGDRLENAPYLFHQKHPTLLGDHPVTELIASQAHLRSLHTGTQLTLATIRQEYWIVKARTMVKKIIHKCIPCTRERANVTTTQLMGQLPAARVSAPFRAFTHCSVDYADPICTRHSSGRGIKSHKGYIAIFICLASKAIHLELVSSYASPAFWMPTHASAREEDYQVQCTLIMGLHLQALRKN